MTSEGRIKNIWNEMQPATIRRVALAAFLLFGVLGLVSVLIDSSVRVYPWSFVTIQAVASGGMAASIIVCIRRRWWYVLIVVILWTTVMLMNGGGLNFIVTPGEGLRVRLGKESIGVIDQQKNEPHRAVTESDLADVYTQRSIIGAIIIVCAALGYAVFIRVVTRELKHRVRLQTEVAVAQEIQQSLLPPMPWEHPAYDIFGITVPATEVGGDYFDVVNTRGGELAITIADVAGHGIGAGILSSMTKSAFRLQLEHDAEPASVLRFLNSTLHEVSGTKAFVTFAYALLDPDGRSLRIVTAGHPPVLFRRMRTGEIIPLRSRNPALGMQREVSFSDAEKIACESGDIILLYTDGLSEAMNPKGEQFGDAALHSIFSSVEGTSAGVCQLIMDRLRDFTRSSTFADDISIVCVRVK